ncbi:aminotransferase class IV [Paenibacillus sp. DMB20]|uniref:aminotransferase class IV n=1 Tax=Paenibacillus sp. DMB20 TaxID=1642570 RepID=UPI000627803D|nr:aminotransferase class IV [Paenibacillus sp. DMB20]KKO55154.1 4-amino-4-deoxychorismate lyase [Paenibacillus sp. DMB20]
MSFMGVDGRVVDTAGAVVSVMDHGLLYGMGLFETFRTYGGVPFLLERHLERLEESCRLLDIRYQPDPCYIEDWISRILSAGGLKEAYIRFTVTAGEEALGLPSGDYMAPRELVYVKPLPQLPDSLYTEGKALQLLAIPRNTPETPWRLKSLHYMNNIMAKRELQSYPDAVRLQAEGLMLTGNGELAEGIVSNIFFVKNDTLFTPDTGTGILPGITRSVVLDLADELGLAAQEGRYHWDDLVHADEIFTTGSVQELVPVTRLLKTGEESRIVGEGLAGPVTKALLKAYRQKAGL